MNVSRTVKFILINANPIDISIEQISLTLSKVTIQLVQMQTLDGIETNIAYKKSYRKDNLIKVSEGKGEKKISSDDLHLKLVIPARHRTILSLTIDGTNDPSFYHETITFRTRYEVDISLISLR